MPEKNTNSRREQVLKMSNTESHLFTKECIRTALIYLMNEQEFDKITVTSIIKYSGVSRAAFYRNYTSKEDVLKELDETIYEALSSVLNNPEYRDNPYDFYLFFLQQIQEHKKEFKLFLQAKYPPEFLYKTPQIFSLNSSETAIDSYRRIAATSAVREVAIHWFNNGMKESPEEMATFFADLYKQIYK